MPPRHHRTVDRVIAILESAARSSTGVTLASLANQLGAPKSSIQELTNGLIATGYLVEQDQRMRLGPGPFVLALLGNRMAALGLRHETIEKLRARLGHGVLVGVGMGDSVVYVDYSGEGTAPAPSLEFVARTHSRRSLFATASGKVILSEMPPAQMDSFLVNAKAEERPLVEQFLAELPTIRETGLAINRGVTVPGVIAIATPLRDRRGQFVASIGAVLDESLEAEVDAVGRQLREAVLEIRL